MGLPGSWQIESIDRQAMTGLNFRIRFARDGSVTGNLACNQFNGSYQLTGGRLTISQMNITALGCGGSTRVDLQRSAELVLSANGAATSIESDTLFIRTPEHVFRFRRAQ
jgi:heat shock protein HslJ